jgi:hypothetical protein
MTGHDQSTRQHLAVAGASWWQHLRAAADRLRGNERAVRRVALWSVGVLAGVAGCLIVGVPPSVVLGPVLLVLAIRRPFAGLLYAMIVFTVPLGLWLIGVRALVGLAFGGRDYVLSLSSAVLVCALAAATVLRRGGRLPLRWLGIGAGAFAAAAVWAAIGISHHGIAQTFTGLRLILVPLALIVIVSGLERPVVERLLTVLSWLLAANAVAAAAELAIGPKRLVELGFTEDRAVRYIDGVFRVSGLTEFNAELGMLAGAYLLGYVASWLTPDARPRRRSWHVGAVVSTVCLVLSTSRSGAVLVLAGVLGAVVLHRSRNRVRRRLSLIVAGGLLVAVSAAFVILGVAGSSSLFERFGVWRRLLSGAPLIGSGIGSAGAATYSRVARTSPVFVDNYYVNVGLQFGPVVMVILIALVVAALAVLSRASARHPIYVMPIAIVSGLACASLVIDSWEFPSAILTLILFYAYGTRRMTRTNSGGLAYASPCPMGPPRGMPRPESG